MKLKLLFLLPLAATILSGCNKKSEVIGHSDGVTRYTFEGVHNFIHQETNDYLVKNKASDYVILLPNNPSTSLIKAKEELKELFLEATGVALNEETEDIEGLTHDKDAKYISLGSTKMYESSGLTIDRTSLGTQAVRIQTKDKTVYLNGGDDMGVIFAVYDFLEVLFNFDAFSYDCIHLDKKDDVKFETMDITDIPDIPLRANAWAGIKENPNNLAYRLRTPSDFSDYFLAVADTSVPGNNRAVIHNSLSIIPKESTLGVLYKDYWFSDNGDQICYTAHGDQTAYDKLVEQTAYIIEDGLMTYTPEYYPYKNYVSFTIMDNHATCQCRHCVEAKNKYGADSGAVIVFCNKVMEKVKAWMNDASNAEYRRDDLKLVFFAYNEMIYSPAHFDKTSHKYVVNHPDCQMRNDVGVYYAVSSGFNYQKNIYDKGCQEGLNTYRQWCDIAPTTLLWTYNANFGAYLSHTNSASFYNNDAYQAFAQGHVGLLYNQGAWNSYNFTAFQMLSIYLDAKLSWNSNANMGELINKYFENMFGVAAKDMHELYELENMTAMIMYEKAGVLDNTGIINKPVQIAEYYPFEMLKSWLSILDKAMEKIEAYKEIDMTLYKQMKEHIDLEWVSPAYYMLVIYGKDNLSIDEYNDMVNYFVENIVPLKQFLISERSGSLSAWITELSQGN